MLFLPHSLSLSCTGYGALSIRSVLCPYRTAKTCTCHLKLCHKCTTCSFFVLLYFYNWSWLALQNSSISFLYFSPSAKYYLFYLSVHRFTFMSSLFLDLFVHFFLLPTSLTLLHLSPPCLTLPYLPLSPLRLHSESESLSMQLAQGHRADRAVRCGSSTVLAVRYTLIGHSNEPYRSLLWL